MAQPETLRDSLIDELRDLYHAEKQLTKALPKMAKAATHEELRAAFEEHLEETQNQVSRLEEAFEMLEEKVKAKPCAGMAGIIEEGKDHIDELDKGPLLDACLVAAAQRAEHYEMAAYGSAMAWAKALGLDDLAALLDQTLEEEKATDEKLSQLAESSLNPEAAGMGEEDEDEEGGGDEDEDEQPAAPARSARKTAGGRAAKKTAGRRR